MAHRAFTLLEIIIIVVVVAVLATVGLPVYKNTVEDSKAKVCQVNLKAISAALDVYAMEHDTIPGDLSKIPSEYLEKAYAKIMQEKGSWRIKLAYFIVGSQERGLAYAGLLHDISGGNIKLITCPADTTPPSAGGVSYAISGVIANQSSRYYRALAGGTTVVADSNSANGLSRPGDLDPRHKRYNFLSANKYGLIGKKDKTTVEFITTIGGKLKGPRTPSVSGSNTLSSGDSSH